jgi:hypothetical protein
VQHIKKYYSNNTSSIPWALLGLFKVFNNVTCQLFELIFTFQNFKFQILRNIIEKIYILHGVCGEYVFPRNFRL